jgi:hypothetical protein
MLGIDCNLCKHVFVVHTYSCRCITSFTSFLLLFIVFNETLLKGVHNVDLVGLHRSD